VDAEDRQPRGGIARPSNREVAGLHLRNDGVEQLSVLGHEPPGDFDV
jgi:hypothetical protein